MPPTTKKRSRLELQERDLDIFETIYDLRFATLNHLAALFPSTNQKLINPNAEFKAGQKAIANRISKLARQSLAITTSNALATRCDLALNRAFTP